MNDRTITHRRFGYKLHYEFREDELLHSVSDIREKQISSSPYENIGVRHPSYLVVNNWMFALGFSLGFLLLLSLLYGLILLYDWSPLFLFLNVALLVGFVSLRLRVSFTVEFIVLPVGLDAFGAQAPPVIVLDNEDGQEVIEEIRRRWRDRLRDLFASVDEENDPQREAQKFTWLRDNEVIDEAEYQAALGQLEVTHWADGSERPLN